MSRKCQLVSRKVLEHVEKELGVSRKMNSSGSTPGLLDGDSPECGVSRPGTSLQRAATPVFVQKTMDPWKSKTETSTRRTRINGKRLAYTLLQFKVPGLERKIRRSTSLRLLGALESPVDAHDLVDALVSPAWIAAADNTPNFTVAQGVVAQQRPHWHRFRGYCKLGVGFHFVLMYRDSPIEYVSFEDVPAIPTTSYPASCKSLKQEYAIVTVRRWWVRSPDRVKSDSLAQRLLAYQEEALAELNALCIVHAVAPTKALAYEEALELFPQPRSRDQILSIIPLYQWIELSPNAGKEIILNEFVRLEQLVADRREEALQYTARLSKIQMQDAEELRLALDAVRRGETVAVQESIVFAGLRDERAGEIEAKLSRLSSHVARRSDELQPLRKMAIIANKATSRHTFKKASHREASAKQLRISREGRLPFCTLSLRRTLDHKNTLAYTILDR